MSSVPDQIYRHSTYSSVKAWRERHGRYRLVGSRCENCEAKFFPRRVACPRCGKRQMKPYECSHTGKVVVVWAQVGLVRLLGYADLPPRSIAIVRLDDGTHIETEIVDLPSEQIAENGVGMRVGLVFRKIRRESNGNWCYGYKFSPLAVEANDNQPQALAEASAV